jgi:predicted transcriptional regulator
VVRGERDILHSGRRDRSEIIAAIVALAQKPAKVSSIMDKVSLSYSIVKDYVRFVIELKLIQEQQINGKTMGKVHVYEATEKGLVFLRLYCELLRLMYGKDFLSYNHNLAVACLNNCKES